MERKGIRLTGCQLRGPETRIEEEGLAFPEEFTGPEGAVLLGEVDRGENIPAQIRVEFLHELRVVFDGGGTDTDPFILTHAAFVYMHHFGLGKKVNPVSQLFELPAPEGILAVHEKIIGEFLFG